MGYLAALPPFNTQVMLAMAFACMALVLVGGVLGEGSRRLGALVKLVGNLGLTLSFGLTMAQLAHLTTMPATLDQIDEGVAMVSGHETRIAMAGDGHFWVRAKINGQSERFLIDTGATLTAIGQDLADQAGIAPADDARRVVLHTANGTVEARLGRIARLQVGNVSARDTSTVIAPDLGGTNVLGMNFLTGLAGWRVEGKTLVLTPKGAKTA